MTFDDIEARFDESIADRTDEELKLLALSSPAAHFALFCTIRDKDNRVLNPTPNIMQLRMSQAYETMRDLGAKVRIIVTKPRRAGCSSFASHIVYHHGMTRPIETIVISDVKEHSAELMTKLKEYSKTDAFPWGHKLVQNATHSLAWSNGTKCTIDTAENPDAGVGGTRQAGLMSEVSKWPQTATRNDKKTMAAVLPSLSGQDTVVIAESTPEGAAGWQYSTWQEAVTLEEFVDQWHKGFRPEEQWVKVFAAWFEFSDNARKQPVSEAEVKHLQATLDQHERDEIAKYSLTWEQVAWRRDTIKSVCNGDPKIFAFYYPSDDVSCWLASGTPRFDMVILADMERRAKHITPDSGYLYAQDSKRVTFQRMHDGTGDILLWEEPREGLRYLVTIDPATDESQTIGADPDRHSVSVWRDAFHDTYLDRWMPAKKVARLRPPFYGDGDEVAAAAALLSKFYGFAMTVIEINCGLDVLRLLREAGIPCHKRRPLSHRTGEIVEQYGFRMTDKQERNAVIEGFAAAIREKAIDVTCLHSLNEYKMFITKPNGRAEAASGAHDDDVLADAIAWQTMPSATTYKGHRVSTINPPDMAKGKRGGWRTVNAVKRGF